MTMTMKPQALQKSPSRLVALHVLAVLLIGGAVWAVYGRVIQSPLIFDDFSSVDKNPSIVKLWPLVGKDFGPLNPPRELPSSGRPLVNLSFALNYHFGQSHPAGYHIVNMILHALCALLLAAAVRRMLQLDYFSDELRQAAWPLSMAAALLWALHPLQTETVQYITQRTEVMMALFYLATVYASLRYWQSESHRWLWLGVAFLACLAGTGCKEVIATAPLMMLLLDYVFVSGSLLKALRRSWPLYVALTLCWGMIVYLNLGDPRPHSAGFHVEGFPPGAWWLTQTKVLLLYLKLTIWPWPLSIHYAVPLFYSIADAWPFMLAAAAIVIAVVILLWKRNAIGFVGAWVLGLLAPTAIVPLLNEVMQERRMYLPLAGLVMLFVVGGYSLLRKTGGRKIWPACGAVAAVLVVTYGVVSAHRLSVYHQSITLWQSTVDLQPNDSLARNNLGVAMRAAGRLQDAERQYQLAEQIRPSDPEVHNNLGNVLIDLGRSSEATAEYELALQYKPDYPEAHNNLGFQLASRGQTQEALRHYQLALAAQPDYPQALNNLGILMAGAGNLPAAIQAYQRALVFKPDYAEAHNDLAIALAESNRLPEAIVEYQEAMRLKPDYADAHNNLGNALVNAGRIPEAIEQFHQAMMIKPKDAATYNNLGIALATGGKNDEAIENFQQATRLQPDYVEAFFNLAIAAANAGHSQQAIDAAQRALGLAQAQKQNALAQQIGGWLQNYRAQHP